MANTGTGFRSGAITVSGGGLTRIFLAQTETQGTPMGVPCAYTVQGKPTMTNAWGATNVSSRFFRILVEMPK
jgi:hypothetical protein